MSASVVQTKSNANTNVDTDITVVLDTTPHDGNTLVAFYCVRGDHDPVTPSGWTLAETFDGPDFDGGRAVIFHRAVSSTSATVTIQKGASAYAALFVAEVAGVSGIDASDSANSVGASTALSAGPLTAATGVGIIVFAAFNQSARAAEPFTWGTGWTAIDSEQVNASGPAFAAGYRILPLATGTQTATATSSESDGYGWGMISFLTGAVPASTYIDWDEDGFNSFDELPVVSWRIQQGASPEITGGAQPGSATIIVKNPDDDFNPANSSSPLYGKTIDGTPLWIGVNSDGAATGSDPRGLFGGRVKDIEPMPAGGATSSPTVRITAEDALGWYGRTPVSLAYAEGRSHKTFREALFADIGEVRYALADERQTMPLSNADGDLLPILEAVNKATGTRHFVRATDNADDWYRYTTRNRYWRLDGTSDASLNLEDHGANATGWRLSADTVINRQRATVTPVQFTASAYVVWQPEVLPIEVTERRPYTVWVEFDDYVRSPVLNFAYSGSTLVSTLTTFGTTAKVEITRTGVGTGTVTALNIQGQLARRLASETATADDTTSQAGTRGIRAGSDISGFAVGSSAQAAGIANHVVWRYGNPQFRPTLTVSNWIPEMFELQMFDVIDLTSAQLGLSGRLYEIVGRVLESDFAASASAHLHTAQYVLQECKVQSPFDWFQIGSSLLGGTDKLHY